MSIKGIGASPLMPFPHVTTSPSGTHKTYLTTDLIRGSDMATPEVRVELNKKIDILLDEFDWIKLMAIRAVCGQSNMTSDALKDIARELLYKSATNITDGYYYEKSACMRAERIGRTLKLSISLAEKTVMLEIL